MADEPRIAPMGERAILVTFAERIDLSLNARARALADAWVAEGLGRAIPSYASALLHYDPLRLTRDAAAARARALSSRRSVASTPGRLIEIPTRYDGPDLAEVARLSSLDVDDVIRIHTETVYRAFFLGFMPGFAYLGEVDAHIKASRLPEPRTRVPAG